MVLPSSIAPPQKKQSGAFRKKKSWEVSIISNNFSYQRWFFGDLGSPMDHLAVEPVAWPTLQGIVQVHDDHLEIVLDTKKSTTYSIYRAF
jgi:hypothetical protein